MAALLSRLLLRETPKGRKHIDLDSKQSGRKRCWIRFLWQLTAQTWTYWASQEQELGVLLSSMVSKLLKENKETNKKHSPKDSVLSSHVKQGMGVCDRSWSTGIPWLFRLFMYSLWQNIWNWEYFRKLLDICSLQLILRMNLAEWGWVCPQAGQVRCAHITLLLWTMYQDTALNTQIKTNNPHHLNSLNHQQSKRRSMKWKKIFTNHICMCVCVHMWVCRQKLERERGWERKRT